MDATPSTRVKAPGPELDPVARLREIVALLRAPNGCPWDREQSHASLRSGLLEETYEVIAAIDAGDDANLREELGDLLLQAVFHAQIAHEEARFTFDDVATEICEKLIRRHPHVFGEESAEDSSAVLVRWDEIKRAEKAAKGGAEAAAAEAPSALDGVPEGLPALLRAHKVQKKAAKVGFDWTELRDVLRKVHEEIGEIEEAVANRDSAADVDQPTFHRAVEDELGDLLFAAVNLGRKLHVDPEMALRAATDKFSSRFREMESRLIARGHKLEELTLEEMDREWDAVKAERAARNP